MQADPKRICVLRGRDARGAQDGVEKEYKGASSPWDCRNHEHISPADAEERVLSGYAEWIKYRWLDFRGRWKTNYSHKEIRMVTFRRWKKTMSRDGHSTVAVMQLVPNG